MPPSPKEILVFFHYSPYSQILINDINLPLTNPYPKSKIGKQETFFQNCVLFVSLNLVKSPHPASLPVSAVLHAGH